MDTTAVNETVVSSEQSDSFARADNEVDRMPFNFRGEFKQFYKKASQVESGYLGLRDQLNELTNALKENNFDEFFQMNSITGKIDDLYNMWISAVDIANKVNAFLDGGLSNKDINDLNKFITIAKSSQETRENFEIFCKSLEETNNQLKIFNEEVGKYAANETIQALKDKNEDIIKGVNDFSERSKRLFNDMFEAKKSIIDKFANEIEETRKKLIKAHQDVEEKITQLDETAKKELENFDEKFKTIFGDKLVTWQNLNVSNYKKFTKFAFGFYAMNFCFALILGVLGTIFIGAKKNYDAQVEILRETNSAVRFLIENGELELKEDGGKTILNFAAKQNLSIKHEGKIVKLSLDK